MSDFNQALINGTIAPVQGRQTQDIAGPFAANAAVTVTHGDAADVDRAVHAARAAFADWSQTDLATRRAVLEALATAIADRQADIATAITADVGTPEKISQIVQAGLPVSVLRGFAQDAEAALAPETIAHSTVHQRPIGVIAAITPWNYPLHQAMAKVGAALAAGCTMVLKPSELTPRTNQIMMDILASTTPAGVINVVCGDRATGVALVEHAGVDAVSFTGSVAGGQSVALAAAKHLKPCFLELGGKSAGIVLDDADLDLALKAIVNGGLLNTGQTCNALTRILVPAAMLDAAADKVAALADKMTTRLGPVISQTQFDAVQGFIARAEAAKGVTLATGGLGHPDGLADGFYVKPTVFKVTNRAAEIANTEVFGPVLSVIGYGSDDDLVALANGTDYGLAAALWGQDDARVNALAARLRAGQIDINGAPFNPRAPFGGFAHSGAGREMGLHGIREFQRPVSIQRKG
ncbi:aldehyde dehydrogenase family protein [Yoonia sp. MH D7]